MNDFISELEKRLKEYEQVVEDKRANGLMTESTVDTYLNHSRNFVRWCKGDFIPGEKNKKANV